MHEKLSCHAQTTNIKMLCAITSLLIMTTSNDEEDYGRR